MSKVCPNCKEARDFYIDDSFSLECGYCGFEICNVKEQFKEATVRANIKPVVEPSPVHPEMIDRSQDPDYYFCEEVFARILGQNSRGESLMSVASYRLDKNSNELITFTGRYVKKGKIRTMKCFECGHHDFNENGRAINEYACDGCGAYYEIYEVKAKPKGAIENAKE